MADVEHKRRERRSSLCLEKLESRLMLNATVPDAFEPNDSLADAVQLGEVEGVVARYGLSLHEEAGGANPDYFEFTTTQAGSPEDSLFVGFNGQNANLDIELYDSSGTPVASATSTMPLTESLSLSTLPADTYTAKIYSAGGTPARYRLSIQTQAPQPQLIDSDTVNGALVSIYDADPGNGVSAPDIAWSPADYEPGTTDVLVNGATGAALLLGDGTDTRDLGVIVEGASIPIRVIDQRTNPTPLGFVASTGPIAAVQTGADMIGGNLNGLTTQGGQALAADLDDDGFTQDATGVASFGRIGSVVVRGDLKGDVIAAGDVGRVFVLGGNLEADVFSGSQSARGNIGKVMVRARFDRGSQQWSGGNLDGRLGADGRIGHVFTYRGDLKTIVLNTDRVRMARAVHGDVRADIIVDSLDHLMAVGGDLTGIFSTQKDIGRAMAIATGGEGGTVAADIVSSGRLRMIRAVGGDVEGSVRTSSDLNSLQAVRGDIGAAVDVGGNLRHMKSVGGDISGNVQVQGHARFVQAVRGSIVDGQSDGRGMHLGAAGVVGAVGWGAGQGSIAAPLEIDGNARVVRAIGGSVLAPVNIGGRANLILANGGASGGHIREEVSVSTGLRALIAGGDLLGDVTLSSGRLNRVLVRGDMVQSTLDAATGDIGPIDVLGNMENSTITARSLRRIVVRGEISEDGTDGDTDEVHATTGRFFAADRTWRGWIEDATGHDFSGVHAYVS